MSYAKYEVIQHFKQFWKKEYGKIDALSGAPLCGFTIAGMMEEAIPNNRPVAQKEQDLKELVADCKEMLERFHKSGGVGEDTNKEIQELFDRSNDLLSEPC